MFSIGDIGTLGEVLRIRNLGWSPQRSLAAARIGGIAFANPITSTVISDRRALGAAEVLRAVAAAIAWVAAFPDCPAVVLALSRGIR